MRVLSLVLLPAAVLTAADPGICDLSVGEADDVTTAVGYACSSTRRVHFGLGGDGRIASIEIRWPSGARQVLEQPAADRSVTEPDWSGPPAVREDMERQRVVPSGR